MSETAKRYDVWIVDDADGTTVALVGKSLRGSGVTRTADSCVETWEQKINDNYSLATVLTGTHVKGEKIKSEFLREDGEDDE